MSDPTHCGHCGTPLTPSKGAPRKWCSEFCRRTQYRTLCLGGCGRLINHDGKPGRCADCAIVHQRTSVEFRRSYSHHQTKKWTDAEIVTAMRAVAVNGELTALQYEQASADNPEMPSTLTVKNRFETWAKACEAAGLKAVHRRPRSDRLAREGALLAFSDCAADLGHPPTVREYEAWAARTGSPSPSLLRWRWGSWMSLVDAYLEQERQEQAA